MAESETLPAGESSFERVRRRSRRPRPLITWIILAAGGTLIVVGGGTMLATFFRWQSDASKQIIAKFEKHPDVIERIGKIESCRFSFFETAGPDVDEDDVLAFRIRGERNSGIIYVKRDDSPSEEIAWAALRVGREVWPLENLESLSTP